MQERVYLLTGCRDGIGFVRDTLNAGGEIG